MKNKCLWVIGIGLLILLALIICMAYSCPPNDIEKIKAIVAAVSAGSVSLSLILNACSIFNQVQERKLDQTFRVIKRWDDEHYMAARDHTRKHRGIQEGKGTKIIADEIKANEKLERSVIMVLNYFEYIETSIKYKRIDEDIVMGFFAHMIQDILGRYQGYIAELKDRNPLGKKQLKDLKVRVDSYIENIR